MDITEVPDFNKVSFFPLLKSNPDVSMIRCTSCMIPVPRCSSTGELPLCLSVSRHILAKQLRIRS